MGAVNYWLRCLVMAAGLLALAALLTPTGPAAADDPDSPIQPPGKRCCMGMAYFPGPNLTYMYGGRDETGNSEDDTWAWNGTSWSEVNTGTSNPGRRSSTRMVYAQNLDVIVLFGGQNCVNSSCMVSNNETWFFDPSKPNNLKWQPCGCPGERPIARTSEALGYHFDAEYVLLFGGVAGNQGRQNDTWELVGESVLTAAWERQVPPTDPDPRGSAELAFLNTTDPLGHQMVMFGGQKETLAPTDETYLWTGTDWDLLENLPTNPGARFGHRVEYNDSIQKIVMFAGTGAGGLKNDTWFWDGTDWEECDTAAEGCGTTTPPAERCCMEMAYDGLRSKIVIYGGGSELALAAYPDTWHWDPTLSWRCRHNCGL